jgi:putative FmdB family regulatory protein
MPLYEYLCQQCGTRSEALQNMGAPPLTTCDKCGGELKRLISSPAVQFKGAGWYVTDYARKSGPASGGGKGEGKSDSGERKSDSGDKKSDSGDSKPAETKADKPATSSGGSSGSSTP